MASPVFKLRSTAFRWPILLGSLVLSALVISLAIYSVYECRRDYENQARIAARNLSLVLEKHLDTVIEKNDMVLRMAAQELKRQEARGSIRRDDVNRFLVEHKSFLPEVKHLLITDAGGVIRYGADAYPASDQDLSNQDYFIQSRQDPRAGLVIGGPYQSGADKEWAIAFARRLSHADGAFAGVVASVITVESLRTTLSSLDLGEHGMAMLRTTDMRLILRVPDAKQDKLIGSRGISTAFEESLKADPHEGAFTATSPVDGVERSLVYRKLSGAPLYIITGRATRDYLARWRNEVIEQAEVVIAFSLMVLGLAWAAKVAVERNQATSQLLQEAVDSIAVSFSIFDPQDRLVICNGANRDFFLGAPELLVPGARFADMLRAGVSQGIFPEASGAPEQWIHERLRQHQDASGNPFEMKLADGRQLLIVEHRTCSGHTVINHIDITELARYRDHLERLVDARAAELKASIAQFRIFVEQAPTTIAMFDQGMNYLAASQRWVHTYGKGLDTLIGRNYYELHPHVPERWKEVHRSALAGFPQEKDDDILVGNDGRRQWLRWATHPWRDEHGEIGGIMMAVEDVSARKEAEERLLESERRFRTIFEQAAVGLAHTSLDGCILQVNDRYSAIAGYPKEELLGRNYQDISYPEDVQAEWENRVRLLNGLLSRYSMEKRYIRKDGTVTWVNVTGTLIRKASGEPDYFLAAVESIHQRKVMEQALEAEREVHHRLLAQQVAERTEELQASNKQLEGFVYAASHDLKGPLGRISSFSTLLERNYRDRLEGDGLLFLSFIRENALRLTNLVEDLLSHARIDQQTFRLESVDLQAAIQAALDEKAGDMVVSGAVVRRQVPAAQVLADPYGLSQVLHNLLENALKYSASVIEPVIEIGGEEADGKCRLWVRDNGIGFDMEYRDKIFEIFRRLHTYGDYSGSGVGLALVKRAMERMGGRVWAESEPGRGATFYLELETAQDALTKAT